FLLTMSLNVCVVFRLSATDAAPVNNANTFSLKVINYNIWHGLGEGFFKREVLEPVDHKQKRDEKQIADLLNEKPDILFLQEVNPVDSHSKRIAGRLGMKRVFQNTNCGISILGLGIPVNLNMGIAILVRPPLKITKIAKMKLSGPMGGCNPYATFQYAEFRYALFAKVDHPGKGSFLLVNTHFHHGVEWSGILGNKIKEWERRKLITSEQRNELAEKIDKSNNRRARELKNLFAKLRDLRRREEYKNLPVVIAGDFNSTVRSPIYKDIVKTYGMKDSRTTYSPTPYTWDPPANRQNHIYTGKFASPVPTFGKKELENYFKKYDGKQRRIDYLFVSPDIGVSSYALFGHKADEDGIIGSDHFGIAVSLKIPSIKSK
ncbi:MAG: endonuclease/exonuclease/phosphatase family protein, partial [Halobacteriovoraceae bacterium]|nr:endonuclease/exonuclease/phosphatase family protein [Halobacteriovoraceae bacterium]